MLSDSTLQFLESRENFLDETVSKQKHEHWGCISQDTQREVRNSVLSQGDSTCKGRKSESRAH